jgi:uncharacterized membrane protein YbhN (UPF0104 family)
VRYRLYTLWGLAVVDIVKVIVFAHVTFYLGMLVLIGLGCVFEPRLIGLEVHLPVDIVRGIGIGLLGVVVIYVVWTKTRKKPVRIRQVEFAMPSLGLTVLQLIVASLDRAMVAAVLWVLLPAAPDGSGAHPMTFIGFLGLFMVAQIIGSAARRPAAWAVQAHVMEA